MSNKKYDYDKIYEMFKSGWSPKQISLFFKMPIETTNEILRRSKMREELDRKLEAMNESR